ncbi:tigger transposable element-derived protein 1-like [Plakobranchus ocellatus]|uniref:Tigger transposable element-derived protein 1-like n=1 Tax=Plakobranchus ocellatus TaxID=259542 RepID=A0AAV3Y5M0_9GAST|nr:tigger transposable element-derived protein 1-like [Plakobranchus ocellatus]
MAAAPCRGSWTQQELENAMRAINRGEGISVREASKQFGIPRRILRNHISSGSTEKRLGRKPLLSDEEEQLLVDRIARFANIGLPLTAKMIRCYVFKYFEKNNRQHPFTSNLAGEKWFRLFLNRHPHLRHRKAQAMNPARAQKLNRFVVNDHFTKLEQAIIDLDLFDKPDRIFNLDEKGCRLSLHHQQRVIALNSNE